MKPKHDLGSYANKQPVKFTKYQIFPYVAELDTHIQLGLMTPPDKKNECMLDNRGFTLLNFDPTNLILIGQVWVDLSQFGDMRLDLWCKEFPECECTNYHLSTKVNSLTLRTSDLYITIEKGWRYAEEQIFILGNPTKQQQKILDKLNWYTTE